MHVHVTIYLVKNNKMALCPTKSDFTVPGTKYKLLHPVPRYYYTRHDL